MKPRNTSARLLPLLAAAASASLLAACAGAGARRGGAKTVAGGSRPAWVEGESPEFPRGRFVTGVGSADDDATASDRARGEVARVFQADVSVNTSSEQSESTLQQGGKSDTSFSSRIDDQVRTATQKVLEDVDVVARWKDSSTGRFYALAALPKDQGLLAVNDKAHDIGAQAAQYKDALAKAADPFERAKAAAKLMTLAKAWTGLEQDSRVLGGGTLAGDFDTASARADAAKALAALDVAVTVSGEGADAVQSAVVTGLNAAGLSAKSGADKGDVVVSARVDVKEQDSGDARWRRNRAVATITLEDGRAGKAFANFDVTAREDATDLAESRRRTLSSLSQKTAQQVTSAINAFFANQ